MESLVRGLLTDPQSGELVGGGALAKAGGLRGKWSP